jgi:hypothetical protein
MSRATKSDKARQLNAAYTILQRNTPLPKAMQQLSGKFGLSERQAYRYLNEATHLDGPVEVVETSVPITLKIPAESARLLRSYSKSTGLTIGAIVTRALIMFLNTQRRHG